MSYPLREATPMPRFVCPEHGDELRAADGAYWCPGGHEIRVVHGIPRFVSSDGYAGAFGRQWNRFRLTQLDSHTGLDLSEERALRCLGIPEGLDEADRLLAGQAVLEVGCGAGRFTEVLLKHGATVTSVDLSSAVEANAQNFPPSDRHRIVQADVRLLPFAPRQFDGVFCLGVVQHTPNPEQTIALLYEQVRPGGWVAFDHYALDFRMLTWIGVHLARQVFTRLPPGQQLPAVEWTVARLLPVHAAAARWGRLLARALSRVSPVLSYYHLHPELSDELQREWAILDTHDALTDTYKHHRRAGEIESFLATLGLTEIVVGGGGNGIEARGKRPTDAGQGPDQSLRRGTRYTRARWRRERRKRVIVGGRAVNAERLTGRKTTWPDAPF